MKTYTLHLMVFNIPFEIDFRAEDLGNDLYEYGERFAQAIAPGASYQYTTEKDA